MIPKTEKKCQPNAWQIALKNVIRDPKTLIEQLNLPETWLAPAQNAQAFFPLRVSESFVKRMRKQDPLDPLLRQVLPLQEEWAQVEGFNKDPLNERGKNPIPGLLHKFKGRVLLTVTSACPVHCRYCFRRYFSYDDNNPGKSGWQQAFDYIAQDNNIHEVILSGGDPLTLDDDYLNFFLQELNKILHVKIIRIHTRMPIMIPERVTADLLATLTCTRLKPVMVVHCNHPQEIDTRVGEALLHLTEHMMVLNQSVLLQGVNDKVETLRLLSEKLFHYEVLPYYLHQLDPIAGAAHFNVTDLDAKKIHQQLADELPGYLVPKLVREVPGFTAKQVLI